MVVAVRVPKEDSGRISLRRSVRGWNLGVAPLVWLSLCVLLPCGLPASAVAQSQEAPAAAQSQQSPAAQGAETITPGAPGTGVPAGPQQPDQQLVGSITGTVFVQTGAVAVGAHVQLTHGAGSPQQEVLSGDDGQFSFADVPPGPFQITVTAEGFETQEFSGTLHPGEAYIAKEISLPVAKAVTEVRVAATQVEVAEEQVKEQEKQRVLGFIPNFYVTYEPDPAPLTPKLKFQLAWRSVIDPITILAVGSLAGIEQASDDFGGYGQGAEGYAKRFGAAYCNVLAGTFIGSAILPSLLKQDPRYFYRGTGSTKSRLLHALGNAVIAKGDNKKWQPNYSGIIGSFAEGGISYIYTPESDRTTSAFIQNSLIRIAESALAGVFQEFVLRKLTPRINSRPADSHPQADP
jgi:Carboxypeptidase regulatory-like domain